MPASISEFVKHAECLVSVLGYVSFDVRQPSRGLLGPELRVLLDQQTPTVRDICGVDNGLQRGPVEGTTYYNPDCGDGLPEALLSEAEAENFRDLLRDL